MSLLSKKKSKISRFMNDFRSSRRGESLVVETGFPTSLIDLFVKNRDRLNKSKKCKKNKCPRLQEEEEEINSTPSIPFAPFILNSINALLLETNPDPTAKQLDYDSGKSVCVLNSIDESIQEQEYNECVVGVSSNRLSIIGIKVFIVLILALVTKKLVIGITLSAFLLMFLEYLLETELCESGFKRFVVSLWLKIRGKTLIGVEDKRSTVMVATNFIDVFEEYNILIKGREIKEIEFDSREEDDEDDKICELCDHDQQTEILNNGEEVIEYVDTDLRIDDQACQQMLDNNQDQRILKDRESVRSCRRKGIARLRTREFKMFVVKKFGGESKRRRREAKVNTSISQSNSSTEIESIVTVSTGEVQEIDDEDNDQDDEQAQCKVLECYNSSNISELSSDVNSQGNLGRTSNWSSRAFIPIVVVLAGLFGGRIMAMGLTIIWFVMYRVLGAVMR